MKYLILRIDHVLTCHKILHLNPPLLLNEAQNMLLLNEAQNMGILTVLCRIVSFLKVWFCVGHFIITSNKVDR